MRIHNRNYCLEKNNKEKLIRLSREKREREMESAERLSREKRQRDMYSLAERLSREKRERDRESAERLSRQQRKREFDSLAKKLSRDKREREMESEERQSRMKIKRGMEIAKVKAGSRLIPNLKGIEGGKNKRTCLLDAVLSILFPNNNADKLKVKITNAMPKEGDTSIMDIESALRECGLKLELKNNMYIKKGGAAYHLFHENDCRLIIRIKLVNLNGQKMTHFVAWDGKTVYDNPYNLDVDSDKDRETKHASKMAFGGLYPRTEFLSWQITAVFKLIKI